MGSLLAPHLPLADRRPAGPAPNEQRGFLPPGWTGPPGRTRGSPRAGLREPRRLSGTIPSLPHPFSAPRPAARPPVPPPPPAFPEVDPILYRAAPPNELPPSPARRDPSQALPRRHRRPAQPPNRTPARQLQPEDLSFPASLAAATDPAHSLDT